MLVCVRLAAVQTRTAFFALRDAFFSHAKSGDPVERPRRKLMKLRAPLTLATSNNSKPKFSSDR